MNKTVAALMCFSGLVAAENAQSIDNKQILDKMYNDIIKSIPASQRAIIDTCASPQNEQVNGSSNTSLKNGFSQSDTENVPDVSLPDAVNKELQKMIQQIDTMRHKRMIHFKSVTVPNE